MIDVQFSSEFLRELGKLPEQLQEEAADKINLFKDRAHHRQLRVHKLRAQFAGCWAFSVNYRFRIIFMYPSKIKSTVILITVGDHSIYD